MKILALTNLYPPHYLGGYELICQMVVNELRSRGHVVQVLTSNHVVGERASAPEEPQVERALRIHGFYGHPWLRFSELRHLEHHNNSRLRSTISRFQPDLVYVWNMGGLSKSMVFTLQAMGIPTAFYISDHWIARGFTSDVWLRWWNLPAEGLAKRALRLAAQLCGYRSHWQGIAPTNPVRHLKFQRLSFCSKALRKLTASAGFEVMHGAVIYAPVDLKRFGGEPRAPEAPVRKLLWVGRLAEDKGIMTALRAMRLLQPNSQVELHVYGKGDSDYTSGLKKFVSENHLPVFFSSAGMEEMPTVYRQHDALLFTSEWAEPFALTPLEAMASGLPVIGTTTGGSREIFRHEDNALTYTAGNPEELAKRIQQLVENPSLRGRLARTGWSEVRAQYALPGIVDQIETYLEQTLRTWCPPGLPHYSNR